jgi:hypothetical protein
VTVRQSDEEMANRINEYLKSKNSPLANEDLGKDFVEAGKKYGNHPYFLVAIIGAENSFGKNMADKYNLGSYLLTDSACAKKCPNIGFKSFREGIFGISQTLSNDMLGEGTRICDFSRGGWKVCPDSPNKAKNQYYASSLENWHTNTTKFFGELLGKELQGIESIKLN